MGRRELRRRRMVRLPRWSLGPEARSIETAAQPSPDIRLTAGSSRARGIPHERVPTLSLRVRGGAGLQRRASHVRSREPALDPYSPNLRQYTTDEIIAFTRRAIIEAQQAIQRTNHLFQEKRS